jgi:hypothetical protein
VDPRPLGDRHLERLADELGHRAPVRLHLRAEILRRLAGHTSDLGVISAAFFRERGEAIAPRRRFELRRKRSADNEGGLDAPRERADGA